MTERRASIVIPVWNQSALTAACLESLLRTSCRTRFEVVVVDNGSTDDTPELLASFADRFDGALVVLRNTTNEGFARACNRGAREATAPVVVFLNNDTEVGDGWLDALIDELDVNPDAGVVGGRLLFPDRTVQHAGVAVGRGLIPFHVHAGLPEDHPLVTSRRTFAMVTGACMAVRRDEFLTVGSFDEGFVNGHEDIDLCLRYRARRREVVYRPDCVVVHHESKTEGRMNHRLQNLQRTLRKWRDVLVQDDFRYAFPEYDRPDLDEPLTFAIKIGPPTREHLNWGDTYFAECLAKSLCRAGHEARIHTLDEWGRDDRDVDVVIHVKGLTRYALKPWNVNVLWMLNHPDLHDDAELERYDLVFVASRPWAERLAARLDVPVAFLPQATDPEHFRPDAAAPDGERFDVLFVGNNDGVGRDGARKIVRDLLPCPWKVGLWGRGWNRPRTLAHRQGEFLPWERLPAAYAAAGVVLNDHQATMRHHGFVNNRTYDAIASGAAVISDAVEGIDDVLPVPTYRTRRQLHALVRRFLDDPDERRRVFEPLRLRVVEEFSFDRRAAEIVDAVRGLEEAFERTRTSWRPGESFDLEEPPTVSILMSTYDRRDLLPEAIRSIRAQTYPRWELLLANDGGPPVDGVVAAFDDPRIRLLDLPHRGKAHAVNRAFEASTGEYVAYLDDDDVWRPEHLERLVGVLVHQPGVRFAYSDCLEVFYEPAGDGGLRETGSQLRYYRQVFPSQLIGQNHIMGIVVVHDRHLFEQVGGWDERLPVLLDWDAWRRMAAIAPPHHVSYTTAERTMRKIDRTTGQGHITSLVRTDPVRYHATRLRILRKDLPWSGSETFAEDTATYRTMALAELQVTVGDVLHGRGSTDRAMRAYLRAHRTVPDAPLPVRKLGVLALEAGNAAEARDLFLHAVRAGSRDLTDYLYAAVTCLGLGQPDDALAVLDGAERNLPDAVATPQARAELDGLRRRAQGLRAGTRTAVG